MEHCTLVSTTDTVKKLITMISNKCTGFYLRFGDGDFNIVEGKHDMLAVPTINFQHWMIETMKISDDSVMTCIPHHCTKLNTLEIGMFLGNHEYGFESVQKFINTLTKIRNKIPNILYTNVALSYCSSHDPDLVVKLHKEIKKHQVVYIGNNIYSNEFIKKLFGSTVDRINTSSRDSYLEHDIILDQFDKLYHEKYEINNFFIIIMAAGCGGRAFSGELYYKYYQKKQNFFILDYGSLLDFLWGYNSRAYMDLDPPNTEYIMNSI